jgi:coenzyme F420-0:L-glutamate ligase/coenzyme F420-1:gamma-L-glutamate ligase
VSRLRPGLLITRHRLGFVCANAGIDSSNVGPAAAGEEQVLLLPRDPDRSANVLREELGRRLGVAPAVVIVDSHGRPHRMGIVGIAIGAAGLPALQDCRGQPDLFGRVLRHTEVGLADLIASAATLLLGQADEATPAVLVRGVPFVPREGNAAELIRPHELDMYR